MIEGVPKIKFVQHRDPDKVILLLLHIDFEKGTTSVRTVLTKEALTEPEFLLCAVNALLERYAESEPD